MPSWSVEYTKRADKDLQNIKESTRRDILQAIRLLAGDPPQGNFEKIIAQKGRWRLKLGKWRIFYTRDKAECVYVILRIVRRSDNTYS